MFTVTPNTFVAHLALNILGLKNLQSSFPHPLSSPKTFPLCLCTGLDYIISLCSRPCDLHVSPWKIKTYPAHWFSHRALLCPQNMSSSDRQFPSRSFGSQCIIYNLLSALLTRPRAWGPGSVGAGNRSKELLPTPNQS